MVLQSTSRVQELLPPASPAAQSPSAETSFKDLLDGALQAQTQMHQEPAKGKQPKEQSGEDQSPKEAVVREKEQPVQAEEPRKNGKEAQTQEAATAVATWIAPITPPALEFAPAPTPAAAEPTQAAQPTGIAAEALLSTGEQPTSQPQAAFAPVIQPEVSPQLAPVPAEPSLQAEPVVLEEGVGVEEIAHVAEPIPMEVNQPLVKAGTLQEKADPRHKEPDPLFQEKFQSLIVKASRELPASKVRAEQPKGLEQNHPTQEAPALSKAEGKGQDKAQLEEKAPEPQKPKAQTPEMAPKELPPVQIRGMQAAEPTKPAAVPTPTQQVETQVLHHLEQGKTEFRMQLAPKELGRVDVRMLLEDGKLTVQILTATSKAAQELQRTGESLAASLRLAGAQLEAVQIVHRPEEPSQQMGGAFDMENGQHPSGESHQGQSPRHQGQETQWEEETYRATETPSRLLDQAI